MQGTAVHELKLHEQALPPLPKFDEGVVFVGHLDPDLDSIASAVAAAKLFNGVAARPGPLNPESDFVIKLFDVESPQSLESVYKGGHFVIVDHNAFAQRPKLLNASKIVGIIDHHALSSSPTMVPKPIYVDIKPWGSCSTVVATKFIEYQVPIPSGIAGLLLSGIISDTLNLKSPTTTHWDKVVLLWLAQQLTWDEVEGSELTEKLLLKAIGKLAHAQFEAKSDFSHLTALEVAMLDFKTYFLIDFNGSKVVVGWSTIETVEPFFEKLISPSSLHEFVEDVIPQIRTDRSLERMFISFVDIERDVSFALCSNQEDCALITKAFPDATVAKVRGNPEARLLGTSPRVSRKDEFIPPLRKALLQH